METVSSDRLWSSVLVFFWKFIIFKLIVGKKGKKKQKNRSGRMFFEMQIYSEGDPTDIMYCIFCIQLLCSAMLRMNYKPTKLVIVWSMEYGIQNPKHNKCYVGTFICVILNYIPMNTIFFFKCVKVFNSGQWIHQIKSPYGAIHSSFFNPPQNNSIYIETEQVRWHTFICYRQVVLVFACNFRFRKMLIEFKNSQEKWIHLVRQPCESQVPSINTGFEFPRSFLTISFSKNSVHSRENLLFRQLSTTFTSI